MPYGFDTPSLASIASPYREEINGIINGAYDFKNTVRTDYLKDLYAPAKAVGAELELANNQFALDQRQQTYGLDLGTAGFDAQLGYNNSRDDNAIYPTLRGLQDQSAVNAGATSVFDSEAAANESRDTLLDREATGQYGTIYSSAAGSSDMEKSLNAYNSIIGSPTASGSLKKVAEQRVTDAARRTLDTATPNAPEYVRAQGILQRFGGYGTVAPSMPPSNTYSVAPSAGWTP